MGNERDPFRFPLPNAESTLQHAGADLKMSGLRSEHRRQRLTDLYDITKAGRYRKPDRRVTDTA